nr:unnamed protein product [Digitaria exilis]
MPRSLAGSAAAHLQTSSSKGERETNGDKRRCGGKLAVRRPWVGRDRGGGDKRWCGSRWAHEMRMRRRGRHPTPPDRWRPRTCEAREHW